jgi:iron-sulfur cluster repair protein YtfE (RIC family)
VSRSRRRTGESRARREDASRPPPGGRDFRSEHEQIVRDVEWMRLMADRVPALSLEERRQLVVQALESLRRIGLHAAAEERVFYPVLARLLGTQGVGDAMAADHRYIHARMQYLAETDPASTAALQALLYGLHAVITTHIQKEDEVLTPLVERLRRAKPEDAPAGPGKLGPPDGTD